MMCLADLIVIEYQLSIIIYIEKKHTCVQQNSGILV